MQKRGQVVFGLFMCFSLILNPKYLKEPNFSQKLRGVIIPEL